MNAMLFAVACVVLLVLPFAPAWREWRRPTDCAPLDIPARDGDDSLQEAEIFRRRMEDMRLRGPAAGYEPVNEVDPMDVDAPAERAGWPVLACEKIRTVGGFTLRRPLYATRDLEFREATAFTDVMSEGELALGPRSCVLRWGHADRGIRLGAGSVAARRLTSTKSVRLEQGCCFRRLHAPVVHFGHEVSAPPFPPVPAPKRLDTLPGAVQRTPGLWRIEGDCHLPPEHVFTGSLVVTGVLTLGRGSRIEGSVKAYQGIVVGEQATLTGAAVCNDAIHVLRDAVVGGPVVSETHLLVRTGARLGHAHAPTTVTAGGIVAEEGAVAHGTVCARTAGVVAEATA